MSATASVAGNPAVSPGTQYHDADLTIGDVIDADADMADEIAEGTVATTAIATDCDLLLSRLEALHAEVLRLRVPGQLARDVAALMEATMTTKARTQEVKRGLVTASESIRTAGSNAAARHRPLADATADAGHARPAEAEYHDE